MVSRGEWFAQHVLPHEPTVRAWLQRTRWSPEEIEDLVQEAYARIASCAFEEIHTPAAFFFQTVRNLATTMVRRRKVVSMLAVADIERLAGADPAPDPAEQLSAVEDLVRIKQAIEGLPEACRRVFVMRKVEGLSQAETARRLGTSESNVEKHVARGLRLCAAALARPQAESGIPGMLSAKFWRQGASRE
jgi:RNA polymerase sigma-70 factor (ECF subfamily)